MNAFVSKKDKKQSASASIFETLRQEILVGKYKLSDKFPSEQQLIRRFKVARTTIRLALSKLKESDALITRKGSGTYLSSSMQKMIGRLGLIVPHLSDGELSQPIYAEIIQAAHELGYSVLYGDACCDDPALQEAYAIAIAKDYVTRHVAGVFLSPIELVEDSTSVNKRIISILESHNIPVILLDRDIALPPFHGDYDVIGIDNHQAGYRLAKHLIDKGARHICLFAKPNSASTVALRFQGAREAMLDGGLRWTSRSICLAWPDDIKTIRHLVNGKPPPDAILCANDITAAVLLNSLTSIGIRVPNDILLTGVDDVQIAAQMKPSLTTIHQPCKAIARTAISTMLQRLRDPSLPARHISLDAPLVIRTSSQRRRQS